MWHWRWIWFNIKTHLDPFELQEWMTLQKDMPRCSPASMRVWSQEACLVRSLRNELGLSQNDSKRGMPPTWKTTGFWPMFETCPHGSLQTSYALFHAPLTIIDPQDHIMGKHSSVDGWSNFRLNRLQQNRLTSCTRGHFFLGDHVVHQHPGVYAHCQLLEKAGFTDIDVAWRQNDWFVIGARRPV